jgi:hypothetical protein
VSKVQSGECSNIGKGPHVVSSRAARKLFEQNLAI